MGVLKDITNNVIAGLVKIRAMPQSCHPNGKQYSTPLNAAYLNYLRTNMETTHL